MIRKTFVWSTIFFTFGIGLLAYEWFLPHTDFFGERRVTITPASGSRRIAAILRDAGVIRSPWAFVAYVTIRGAASSLKPGTYVFLQDTTISRISAALVEGGGQEVTVVIPEGWTAGDIGAILAANNILSAEAFLRAIEAPSQDVLNRFSFLGDLPIGTGVEGYLFPDTYRYFRFADPEAVVGKILENFDAKLTREFRDAIRRSGHTTFDIVTMASLIEKEVRSDEDRKLVSGILWKRLEIGMPLQVDATIIYITGKRSIKVANGDTKVDSPYNTYQYAGLPKGPIANPGLSAIRAAIFPVPSRYLYYLSAEDGTTRYSRTLEEHNTAKAEYLR